MQILRFMGDEEQEDWAKLISVQHIDTATRQIKRKALSLHLAFVVTFAQTLELEQIESFFYMTWKLRKLQRWQVDGDPTLKTF